MKIAFLVRKREMPGTSVHNAAEMDAAFLRSAGHSVEIFTLEVGGQTYPKDDWDLVIVEGAGWIGVQAFSMMKCPVIVRIHCAPEFLNYEFAGICTTVYIEQCIKQGVSVAFVSPELHEIFSGQFGDKIKFLPMVYPMDGRPYPGTRVIGDTVEIGCFGAIRPLKNHLGQLLAVAYARKKWFPEKAFRFHVNSTRIEGGSGILNELQALGKTLHIPVVCHPWEAPEQFRETIRKMDVGMCASMSESFCLTAADFIAAGKPVVGSSHIGWMGSTCFTSVEAIANALRDELTVSTHPALRFIDLQDKAYGARACWTKVLEGVASYVSHS